MHFQLTAKEITFFAGSIQKSLVLFFVYKSYEIRNVTYLSQTVPVTFQKWLLITEVAIHDKLRFNQTVVVIKRHTFVAFTLSLFENLSSSFTAFAEGRKHGKFHQRCRERGDHLRWSGTALDRRPVRQL